MTLGTQPTSPPTQQWVRRGTKAAGGAFIVLTLWFAYLSWDNDAAMGFLEHAGPVPFFAALGFLPALGVPVTPFFILAGATFSPALGLTGIAIAISANLLLSYIIGKSGLRWILLRFLKTTRFSLPKTPPKQPLRFTLLVRLTPGVPVFLKNYILALSGIPFPIYFTVSFSITLAYASCFFALGDSLRDHEVGKTAWALGVLTILLIGFVALRKRLLVRSTNLEDDTRGLRK